MSDLIAGSTWIRLPEYNFFVPAEDHYSKQKKSTHAYSVEWLHTMVDKHGIEWAMTWHQHFLDLKKPDAFAEVEALLKRLKDTRAQMRFVYHGPKG